MAFYVRISQPLTSKSATRLFASAELRVGWSSPALLPAEDHIDASQDKVGLCARELADALGERRLVESNYL